MKLRMLSLAIVSLAACGAGPRSEPTRWTTPPEAAPARAAPAATASHEALPFGVRVTGHGPPMILIPGLASSGDVWDSTVAHEQARFTCYVLDLPGFAGQPPIVAPILPTVRDALAGYIRRHHLDHPVLVGHSLGGFLALDLARSYPDVVGRLVIVDSLPFLSAASDASTTAEAMRPIAEGLRGKIAGGSAEIYEQQQRAVLATMITAPANQELALGWTMHSDRTAVAEALFEVMTTDLRPLLGPITAPTLVVFTWRGWNADRESVERGYTQQYAALRGARLVAADAAKHFVMLDDPPFLFAQLDSFLGAPR